MNTRAKNRDKKKTGRAGKQYITIVVLNNPMKKSGKRIKKMTIPEGQKSIRLDFITQNMPKQYNVLIGGHIISKTDYKKTQVKRGQIVTIAQPIRETGQDVASTLVMVASYAAIAFIPGVGPIVAAAISFVGGAIISQFDPPDATDTASVDNYSWDNPKPAISQGAPIGVTFGEVRVKSPQVLAASSTWRDTTSADLNYLLSGGEGELDSIEDIALNGVALNEENFSDYTLEIKLGTNDQTAVSIAALGESQSAQNFDPAYDLSNTNNYFTNITTHNQVQGLEFSFRAAGGLYAIKNDVTGVANRQGWPQPGTKFTVRVRLSIEYKLHNDATWTVKLETITGNDQTPLLKTYRYNGLTVGQYDVRVKAIGIETYCEYWQYDTYGNNGVKVSNWFGPAAWGGTNLLETYIGAANSCRSIVYDAVTAYFDVLPVRPCISLVALKIRSTNQISGSTPSVNWTQTRSTVWVWDPVTSAYIAADASNPWWAAYDLIHCARKIKNLKTGLYEFKVFGAPKEALLYDEFKTCADSADEQNLKFNYFLNQPMTLAEALKIPVTIGRGAIIIKGSQYGATCDRPRDPVQMFTMGNIKSGSFKETFLPMADRANIVEITYIDKDKSWEKTTMPVYMVDWDDSGLAQNPTGIDLSGITSQEQAFREGKYYLRRNKYIKRTIEFKADVDSIGCDIGDVILIQHDVPTWGQGGRVLAYLGSNRIKLDREVTLAPGTTYNIIIKHAETDEMVTYGATGTDGATLTDDITLDQVLTRAIVPGDDIYTLGAVNIEAKPFEITAITMDGELERTISAQEYSAAVYEETETSPEIAYSANRTITEVINLTGSVITTTQPGGAFAFVLIGSWNLPVSQGEFITSFLYSVSTDEGVSYGPAVETQSMSYRVDVSQNVSYKVKVQTKNSMGQISLGVTTGLLYSTASLFPPDPQGIAAAPQTVTVAGSNVPGWRLAVFTGALPTTVAGFMFRYVSGSATDWASGIPLNNTPVSTNYFDTVLLPAATTLTVMVKLINDSGVLSLNEAHTTFTTPAAAVVTVLNTFSCEPTWGGLIEGNATIVSGALKADALGTTPETYEEFVYSFDLNMGFHGYISLEYDIEGDFVVRYSIVSGTWITYTGPFMVDATTTVSYSIALESTQVQGVINSFTVTQWSPSRTDDTGWHTISSAGATIAPTSPFNVIQVVETNISNTATETATQVQVTNIDPVTGATFIGYDPTGTAAALLVNIKFLGY